MKRYTAANPQCYFRCERPARKGSRFCTQSCAAEWADQLLAGNDNEQWCEECQEWATDTWHESSHSHKTEVSK